MLSSGRRRFRFHARLQSMSPTRRLSRAVWRVRNRRSPASAPGILIEVDQHLPPRTEGNPVYGRHQLRVLVGPSLRQRLGDGPDFLLCRPAHWRHIKMHPLRAGWRGINRRTELLQFVANNQCRFSNETKTRAGNRIEVEMSKLRSIDVVAASVRRVEIDAG